MRKNYLLWSVNSSVVFIWKSCNISISKIVWRKKNIYLIFIYIFIYQKYISFLVYDQWEIFYNNKEKFHEWDSLFAGRNLPPAGNSCQIKVVELPNSTLFSIAGGSAVEFVNLNCWTNDYFSSQRALSAFYVEWIYFAFTL